MCESEWVDAPRNPKPVFAPLSADPSILIYDPEAFMKPDTQAVWPGDVFASVPVVPTEAMIDAGMSELANFGLDDNDTYESGSVATYRAMVAARPPAPALTDAQVEGMAKAHHAARHPAHETPAGGLTRWATWAEVCELPGELDKRMACMRAALASLTGPLTHPFRPDAD